MRPTILCDSREQKWDHVKVFIENNGLLWLRSKLPVGDYTLMNDMSTVIDRKASMNEVEGNLIHQHERFRRECELAQAHGIRLVILVEDGRFHTLSDIDNWVNPRRQAWERIDQMHAQGKMLRKRISPKPPVNGEQMRKIMETMSEKYGVEWQFAVHRKTGEAICRILGVSL